MKNNLLRTFFEWALITSVLMSIGFFVWFYLQSRQVRSYSAKMAIAQATIQNNHTVIGVLIGECREYGKTNADMARFLEAEKVPNMAPAGVPAATAKPRGK